MQVPLCKTQEEFMNAIRAQGGGCVIALDLGARKVGVAKADTNLKIAVPLTTVHYKNIMQLSAELKKIALDNKVIGIIVGLPSSNQQALMEKEVIAFVESLELGLPFVLEDETYSTKIANTLLADAGMKRKKRNEVDDKLSAKIILDSFLSRQ